MSNKEQPKVAMLDTSFLIRLLKEDDPLHASAKASKVINVLAKENGLAVRRLDIHNSLSSFSGTLF